MNKKLNSVPSAGTTDDKRTAADSIVSSPADAKPHVGRSYSYNQPVYFIGDKVCFQSHKGIYYDGEIAHVTTNYGHNFKAYHVYAIQVAGHKRHYHVGEKNIMWVI